MSHGHTHMGGPHMTQNQGNVLGDRPCVRQSRLYREHVGGNDMKGILGQDNLKWDTNRTQGAYEGGRVYDHNTQQYDNGSQQQQAPYAQQQQAPYAQQQQAPYAQQQQAPYAQQQQAPYAQQQQAPYAQQQQASHGGVYQLQQQQDAYAQAPPPQQYGGSHNAQQWEQQQPAVQMQQQQQEAAGHRRGAGVANRTTYNIFTGQ